MKNKILVIALSLFLSLSQSQAFADQIKEASGIVRVGDKLLIVSDDVPGTYFEYSIQASKRNIKFEPDKKETQSAQTNKQKTDSKKDKPKIQSVNFELAPNRITIMGPIGGAELAIDLESIDLLADGRIALLSEQLAALVIIENNESGHSLSLVKSYDGMVDEIGGKGLEGLAIKKENHHSRVAALWEGGCAKKKDLPKQLQDTVDKVYMKPHILVHDIPNKIIPKYEKIKSGKKVKTISLEISKIQKKSKIGHYRAKDLVWHKDGFIVLLDLKLDKDPSNPKCKYPDPTEANVPEDSTQNSVSTQAGAKKRNEKGKSNNTDLSQGFVANPKASNLKPYLNVESIPTLNNVTPEIPSKSRFLKKQKEQKETKKPKEQKEPQKDWQDCMFRPHLCSNNTDDGNDDGGTDDGGTDDGGTDDGGTDDGGTDDGGTDDGPVACEHSILQAFDKKGNPVGDLICIPRTEEEKKTDAEIKKWEGMDWYKKGKSVILIHDSEEKASPDVLVVKIPDEKKSNGNTQK